MGVGELLLLCFSIGCVTGLRSMTGIALVCWGVHLGWLHPSGKKFFVVSSLITLTVFSVLAVGEMVADKFPIPPRITFGPLVVRVLFAAFCAAVLSACIEPSGWMVQIFFGAVGAVAGAFAGYWLRKTATTRWGLKDLPVALVEDAIAVLVGLVVVSRF